MTGFYDRRHSVSRNGPATDETARREANGAARRRQAEGRPQTPRRNARRARHVGLEAGDTHRLQRVLVSQAGDTPHIGLRAALRDTVGVGAGTQVGLPRTRKVSEGIHAASTRSWRARLRNWAGVAGSGLLVGHLAAVYIERLAGDVPAPWPGQEHRHSGDILRLVVPAQRNRAVSLAFHLAHRHA